MLLSAAAAAMIEAHFLPHLKTTFATGHSNPRKTTEGRVGSLVRKEKMEQVTS